MKKLNKIFRVLVYILPAVLMFSYYPVITLGSSETMNFELSLPFLWLLVFDFVAVIIFILKKDFSIFKKWWWFLFPVFATISLIWSENLVRGILTVGILWLTVFAIYAILRLRKIFYDERGFYYTFLKFFFGSALVVCVWCLLQCILDAAGVPRDCTLLCRGCVYSMFGFPHPNGFAIEPQFMGNLLLAPTLISGWLMLHSWPRPSGPSVRADGAKPRAAALRNATSLKHYAILFFIFTAALFLTFSRGAIYAFGVALIFMSVALMVRKVEFKKIAKVWGIVILSFVFTLNLQGVFAQVSPTNDTYFSGVSKVLNHLSLGIIDIRGGTTSDDAGAAATDEIAEENDSIYDGYVEESTNIRMDLTKNAIKVWLRDFKTIMFGVGIGGAGQAMYDAGLTDIPKEIVQNEYASLLLETGLVGIILVIFTFVMILKILRKNPMSIIILTLGVSYGISLLFFSGLANALQIYLLPPVLYIVLRKKLVS